MEKMKAFYPDWETVRPLGRGNFGSVYEIQRTVEGKTEKAALKVISIPQNETTVEDMYNDGYTPENVVSVLQSHVNDLIAEFTQLQQLGEHANIAHYSDIRVVPHDTGIGWDLLIKTELLTPLVKALPVEVPEETVVQMAKELCAALNQCKMRGILHRDIKPQNIFLSDNGTFQLNDFGIAKIMENNMGRTNIGAQKFAAPEVYHSLPYGTSSDVYSLGLVLYWLLNERRMPFLPLPPADLTAGMDEEARRRRMSGQPLPPPAHGSAALKQIVLKACAHHPANRYTSATEMLEALNDAFADEETRLRKQLDEAEKRYQEALAREASLRNELAQERTLREQSDEEQNTKAAGKPPRKRAAGPKRRFGSALANLVHICLCLLVVTQIFIPALICGLEFWHYHKVLFNQSVIQFDFSQICGFLSEMIDATILRSSQNTIVTLKNGVTVLSSATMAYSITSILKGLIGILASIACAAWNLVSFAGAFFRKAK